MTTSPLCVRKEYCEFAGYCKRVHPKIQKELLKNEAFQPSKIEVEKFKCQGSGAACTRRD